MDDIEKVRSFKFDRKSETMGCVKMTVTQINAGTQHNVVPDKCSWVIDIRPTDCYKSSEIMIPPSVKPASEVLRQAQLPSCLRPQCAV